MGRQVGYLKCILLTGRSQFGKVAYPKVPIMYDIWEKANYGKNEKISGDVGGSWWG